MDRDWGRLAAGPALTRLTRRDGVRRQMGKVGGIPVLARLEPQEERRHGDRTQAAESAGPRNSTDHGPPPTATI